MEYTDMEQRILDMWPKFEDGSYLNGKSACDEYVRIDLIRRAKALAEKEAAR